MAKKTALQKKIEELEKEAAVKRQVLALLDMVIRKLKETDGSENKPESRKEADANE